jgi:hypothetical protein
MSYITYLITQKTAKMAYSAFALAHFRRHCNIFALSFALALAFALAFAL